MMFVVFLLGISSLSLAQTFVPDDNFEQALIDLGLDTGPLDNLVPTANINTITVLEIYGKNIADLTGIEDFLGLEILNCDDNQLTTLDVTKNTALTELYFRNNQIPSIDVSMHPDLKILWCENNQLSSLNISNNTKLISLVCGNNPINNLDVTNNTLLSVLNCDNNQLTSLDITQNTALTRLNCNYNFLTSLNTSNNTGLTNLACGDNLITTLNLTNNINLLQLFCARIAITSLDVTQNTSLSYLAFGDNQISSIDLSNNKQLTLLWCAINLLTDLDLSQNVLLESLLCARNSLTSLDLSKNVNLLEFNSDFNSLCTLNIKNENNSKIISYSSLNNPNLSCIYVDDIAYSTTNWVNIDNTSNFINTQAECDAFGTVKPFVDSLNDVIVATGYTLPPLTYGDYYTASGGNGTLLNPGDVISTSQIIYIYTETACDSNESSFSVLINDEDYYIPKYFTPNNDGIHDYWKVIDNTNTIKNICIYNRQGKLLKTLSKNAIGWDGTFNGKLLNTDDYWYVITLNTGNVAKGHFTLKR